MSFTPMCAFHSFTPSSDRCRAARSCPAVSGELLRRLFSYLSLLLEGRDQVAPAPGPEAGMQKAPDRQLPEEEGAILPQGGTPSPWLHREWVLGWKSKPIRGGGKPRWSYLNLPRTQPWAVGSSCSPSSPRCPLPVPSTSLLCPDPPMFPFSEKQMSTVAHRPLQPHPLRLLNPLPSLLPHSGLPHWPSGCFWHMPSSYPGAFALLGPSAWYQVHWAWALRQLFPHFHHGHLSGPPYFT